MLATLNISDLIEYTGWEREKWHARLQKQGPAALSVSAGAHGDGRFATVGDVVRHIFTAEKRYVERILNRPLTDAAAVPNDDIEALFAFGRQSRREFQDLLADFPDREWDVEREFHIVSFFFKGTPRKIVVHVLMHEIRHWAQIATLLRLNGITDEFHDFLFSPVLGGEFGRITQA